MTYEIYVNCLSAYTNGIHHGNWINIDELDEEEIQAEINEILAGSPMNEFDFQTVEEWFITAYEGFAHLNEYQSLEEVIKLRDALKEHGEAFYIYYDKESHMRIDELIESFEDKYIGTYKSTTEFIEDYYYSEFEELNKISFGHSTADTLIDYEQLIYDLECNGFSFINDSSVYVFSN